MSSSYGENIRLTIFGQSHSEAIGMTLEGIPAGSIIDPDRLLAFMARRAPGGSDLSTPRKEADLPEFLSGVICRNTGSETPEDSKNVLMTCGVPISAIIRNTNTRSKDYSELKIKPRPGHADYTAEIKYHGAQDFAGGGHFSGRLTAPMCIAGNICLQLLENEGIQIFTRVYSIGHIKDNGNFERYICDSLAGSEKAEEIRARLAANPLPVLDPERSSQMREHILAKKAEGDSCGGIIECVITGLPAGLGDPMFDGMENRIAQAVFGIPAVKGLEFGAGFASSRMTGSENNDPFCTEDGKISTLTNNCGGILGGITDGMPLVFRAAFKPTPSIAKAQQTVNLETMENTTLEIHGRHDPCIVVRALPVVEAAAALAVYDAFLGRNKE